MLITPYLHIDKHGIGLIKNHVVEKHIDYSEIKAITFRNGFISENWIRVLCIGIISFTVFLFWSILTIDDFSPFWYREDIKSYLLLQITPWILLVGSAILIYSSLRRGRVLIIETSDRKYKIPLMGSDKNKEKGLINLLNNRSTLTIE